MSFSKEVRAELCTAKLTCKMCAKALLYGIVLCENRTDEHIWLTTNSKETAELFISLIKDIKVSGIEEKIQNELYSIFIYDASASKKFCSYFKVADLNSIYADNLLQNDCCKTAFLRGVYLSCGTVTNPLKEYHLELNIHSADIAGNIIKLLSYTGIQMKSISKNKSTVLYLKESNQIEDFLTYLGAVKSSLYLMNLKIEKEVRNNVNRITNCETANIEKTVNASMNQIEKIKKIRDTIGIEALPQELQDTALMRLLNPDASLNELCKLSTNKISKSGLNHRLKKIMEIADNLIEEE